MLRLKNRWIPIGTGLCLTLLMTPPVRGEEAQARGAEAATGAVAPPVVALPGLDREIESVRALLAKGPDAGLQVKLGNLLLRTGDPDGALAAFTEALRLNPRLSEAKTGKGVALSRKGLYPEAEKALKDALQLNPDPVRTHYELGLLYEKQGDLKRALASYKEGVKKFRDGRK